MSDLTVRARLPYVMVTTFHWQRPGAAANLRGRVVCAGFCLGTGGYATKLHGGS